MADKKYDVVAIGNAIVDVISTEDEAFVEKHGLERGAMTLIDEARGRELYAAMGPGTETSGGSAANTMAGLASFGARGAFIGKVRDDQLGEVFAHDIRAAGVHFDVAPAMHGPPTARCLIVVTPDAARTMNTFLGIAGLLEPDDIDADLVADSSLLYCEGYIWDVEVTKEAIRKAIDVSKAAGSRVSFTLSDPFCVERHHGEFLELVDGAIDVLFGNRQELCALYRTNDVEDAIREVQGRCEIAAITRGAEGCTVVTADELIEVPAEDVPHVVDTTGAGDLFASGFLYGLSLDLDLEVCARLASVAAAEVISHLGARPEVWLHDLATQVLRGEI